jgi:hypothetical protein
MDINFILFDKKKKKKKKKKRYDILKFGVFPEKN